MDSMKRRELSVVALAGLFWLAGTLSAQTTGKITETFNRKRSRSTNHQFENEF
jgi:hypothetical protein